jgi:hypothetical protein
MRLLGLGLALLLLAPAAPAQTKKAQAKAEDAFFSGPPFSLNDILQRVGIIADKRLSAAIQRRGISFSPTPADFDRLKQAGASPDLLKTIGEKAPPPPKATPAPPARAGRVTLECAPAECDILVNSRPRGKTANGKLELANLDAGQAVIDFKKEGFEGQQVVLPLRAGAPAARAVTLKPTPATQAETGKQLFARLLDRLGGAAALQKASTLAASGNASLWQTGGVRSEWEVTARLRLPSLALIEISGAKQKWWTSLNNNDSKSGGTKKMSGGPVALEIEKLVRLYRDYQPATLVSRLRDMNLTAPDGAADASGEWRLRAAGRDAAYQITLLADDTPARVVYESPSGLGSGIEVHYADFTAIEKVWYPKSMTIKFADQAQHGLELHFSEVSFPAKVADKEFHR